MAGESPFFERLAAGEVERLARVLARMPNLESLDLAGGFMGNEAAEVLCSSLAAEAGRGLSLSVGGWLYRLKYMYDNTTHTHTRARAHTHTNTHTHTHTGGEGLRLKRLNLCLNDLSERSRSVSFCVS